MIGRIFVGDNRQCSILNIKAVGFMFQGGSIFFSFPHYKPVEAYDSRSAANLDPGAWLTGFMQMTTKHWPILNIYDVGLTVSGEDFFTWFMRCFMYIINCYTYVLSRYGAGLMVLEN